MAQDLAESTTIVRLSGRRSSILKVLQNMTLKVDGEVILSDMYSECVAEFKVKYLVKGNWRSDIYRKVNKTIAECNVMVTIEIRRENFKRKVVEGEEGKA